MSIRVRIILLAAVTLLALVGALSVQYLSLAEDIAGLGKTETGIRQAQRASALIHALQQERGLSAGYLINLGAAHFEKLSEQREATDRALAGFTKSVDDALIPASWAAGFQKTLSIQRNRINSGDAKWPEVKAFYTSAIDYGIDKIAIEVLSDSHVGHRRSFMAIVALLEAREHLGLIRAAVNRIYTRKTPAPAEIKDVLQHFVVFNEARHAFWRDVDEDQKDDIKKQIESPAYQSVTDQIDSLINEEAVSSSPFEWWEQATQAIDTMKAVEDRAYATLAADALTNLRDKRKELYTYAAVAILLTALIVLVAVITVLRILNALSVLLKTLGRVVVTQDYDIRIHNASPTDEFGQISLSVNDLLSYTDTIIKEKEFLANTDLLTGALNRRSFTQKVVHELIRTQRYELPATLILADIDHFKAVNDTYGHDAGDEVLKTFSALLSENVRDSDIVARWGGEEFVIFAPNNSLDGGMALAEKIRRVIEETKFGQAGKITCSFGVAEARAGEDFDLLFKRADDALYQAKKTGRNRVVSS